MGLYICDKVGIMGWQVAIFSTSQIKHLRALESDSKKDESVSVYTFEDMYNHQEENWKNTPTGNLFWKRVIQVLQFVV